MTATTIEGGCFCGAVRYRVTLAPRSSMICHCRSCRRIAGAPVVAWVTFAAPAFEFTRGAPAELRSSPGVCRRLCANCGTPLTYEAAGSPGEIDVTTCSLDDPEAYPPTFHAWLEHGLSWLPVADGLPTFARGRSDT